MHIPPSHIDPNLEARDQFDAIGKLLDRLVDAGAVPAIARKSIFHGLCEREKTMTTGFLGLALPHTQSELISEPVAAFGRSFTGIDYHANDNIPVRLIFLLIAPKDRFAETLRDFANRLKLRAPNANLDQCQTAGEISAFFNGIFDP